MDNVSTICEPDDEKVDSHKISNNAGSDFLTSLNSVPSTRGFKMAFLNIVSLPKNLDEIRYSMSSKHIDLIAFNETRLDSNLNNNMVHINYDIIQKDRSRSGGGVKQATRITMTNCLIDHIVTNTPEKISDSGVIHTGIRDHSLIFAIRKISIIKKTRKYY